MMESLITHGKEVYIAFLFLRLEINTSSCANVGSISQRIPLFFNGVTHIGFLFPFVVFRTFHDCFLSRCILSKPIFVIQFSIVGRTVDEEPKLDALNWINDQD